MRPVRPWPSVDFDLINRLAPAAWQGDQDAADCLFALAPAFVEWVIRKNDYYPPRTMAIDDLIQEGLFGFLEALRDWSPRPGHSTDLRWFTKWAELCTARKLVTAIKTANRIGRRAQNEALSLDAPTPDSENPSEYYDIWELPDPSGLGADPAGLAGDGEEVALLLVQLQAGLSQLERTVVLRCLLLREPYHRIVTATGHPYKTIDNALQRARRKLLERAAVLAGDPRLSLETRERLAWVAAHRPQRINLLQVHWVGDLVKGA